MSLSKINCGYSDEQLLIFNKKTKILLEQIDIKHLDNITVIYPNQEKDSK